MTKIKRKMKVKMKIQMKTKMKIKIEKKMKEKFNKMMRFLTCISTHLAARSANSATTDT